VREEKREIDDKYNRFDVLFGMIKKKKREIEKKEML
jgi:hypothetical protein